jgi:hypothetical protein
MTMKDLRFFHYTIGSHLPRIVGDGVLRPSTPFDGTSLPALWLSTNPLWEGSVAKSVMRDGKRCLLDKHEIANLGRGLVRFEVRGGDHVCTWPDFIARSGVGAELVRHLEESGRRRGADPEQWYGALRPVERAEWLGLWLWDDEPQAWQPVEL